MPYCPSSSPTSFCWPCCKITKAEPAACRVPPAKVWLLMAAVCRISSSPTPRKNRRRLAPRIPRWFGHRSMTCFPAIHRQRQERARSRAWRSPALRCHQPHHLDSRPTLQHKQDRLAHRHAFAPPPRVVSLPGPRTRLKAGDTQPARCLGRWDLIQPRRESPRADRVCRPFLPLKRWLADVGRRGGGQRLL